MRRRRRRWEAIRKTVAHEFGHVLLRQHVTKKLQGLLNEGLACYVEAQVGDGKRNYGPPPSLSWRILARWSLFYEWRYVERPEYPAWQMYEYAGSMATFLIQKHGIVSYLKLCRHAACMKEEEAGASLAIAVKMVYGIPVEEMEREWREWESPLSPIYNLKNRL